MSNPPPHPGMPRWVKAFCIVAFVLLLLFLIQHLREGGFRRHGPASTVSEHRSYRM